MLCSRLVRQCKLLRVRQLHTTLFKNENKPASEKPKHVDTEEELRDFVIGPVMHRVTNLDKRILVWVKRFPSMDQVPKQVSHECLKKAYTKARIYVCYYMMAFAIVGFIVSAMIGKRDVAAGKNIVTERMKWYENVRQLALKEQAEKEAEEARKAAEQAEKV